MERLQNYKTNVTRYISSFALESSTKYITVILGIIFFINLSWSLAYYLNKYDKNSEGLVFTVFNFIGFIVTIYVFFIVLNSYTEYESRKSNRDKDLEKNVKEEIDMKSENNLLRNFVNSFDYSIDKSIAYQKKYEKESQLENIVDDSFNTDKAVNTQDYNLLDG